MKRPPLRLSAESLESRLAPAVNFQFNFEFDQSGFFNNVTIRNILEAAANQLEPFIQDQLLEIPAPTVGTDGWAARIRNPSGSDFVEIPNLVVPENTIIVYVGAKELVNPTLTEPFSDLTVSSTSSQDFRDLVTQRGQENAIGAGATDVGPWGGSLSFDLPNTFEPDWYFGFAPPPAGSNQPDFYSAVQRGLFQILGFGTSDAFGRLSPNATFVGPNATAVFGSAVPLAPGDPPLRWQQNVGSPEGTGAAFTLMEDSMRRGFRIPPSRLDVAAMVDIGWEVGDTPTTPPPPAAPPPPMVPPQTVPPGLNMHLVGSGEGAGLDATITYNESSTFTEVSRQVVPFSGAQGGSFTGGARVVTGQIDSDGVPDIIVGPGPGIATEVKVYSGANYPVDPNGSLLRNITSFEASFTGGVYVAAGDVNGDGVDDIAFSPDEGGGPRVRVFDGSTFEQLADFFGIDDPNFRGGARVALADISGDGVDDLLVAAGFGGGPRLAGFDGNSLRPGMTPTKIFSDFFVFEETLRNGIFIAGGDVDGDGNGDVIAGGGPGGGPRVTILSGLNLVASDSQATLANFFAGDENNRGGVRVGVENIDSDGQADLLTGAGTDAQPVVTTYLGRDMTPTGTPPVNQQYLIFDASFLGGVFVG